MKANTVGAVVFDMDGLMLDTEPLYKAAWQAASAEFGYMIDDPFYATLVGRPNDACDAAVVDRFGQRFPLDRFRARRRELWRAEIAANGVRQKTGLLELLAFLRARQLPMAVATSTTREPALFCLQQGGLGEYFNVIVTGDEVPRGKPSPDIYLEAARRLQVGPSSCVALEDSEAGILAATRAGMRGLLIPDWVVPSPIATEAAFLVLGSLSEVIDVLAGLIAHAPIQQSAGRDGFSHGEE